MVLTDKKRKYFQIYFILLLLSLFGTVVYLNGIAMTKAFNNFNRHNIRGEIAALNRIRSSTFSLQMKNDDTEYEFYQEPTSYDKRDISKFVHKGDSIFKEALSDTILIRSNYRFYKYVIEP